MTRIYRTPEENFHNLPGFPYKLQYWELEVENLIEGLDIRLRRSFPGSVCSPVTFSYILVSFIYDRFRTCTT